jgi:RecA/RadA recombinase
MGFKNADKWNQSLQKKGMSTGFATPTDWVSTGNNALNFLLTGDMTRGFCNKRSFMIWGPQGSGKSYLLTLAARDAQKRGYHVVWIDTETATEESYMKKCGLDIRDEDFSVVQCATFEDAWTAIGEMFKLADPTEDKIFLAIDSLSMMLSEKEMKDFDTGVMKGDQGQGAKKLKLLMKNLNARVGRFDMLIGCTGHAYANQDLTNGKGTHIFSGGESSEFIPSFSVFVKKLELKDGGEVKGIRIKAKVVKSRFNQYGQSIELHVPYDGGIDPLDGMLDIALDIGIVEQRAAWYSYEDRNGETIKFQRKKFNEHYPEIFREWLENEIELVEDDDVDFSKDLPDSGEQFDD